MGCKICGHKDRDSIEKLISEGCRPVTIINEFPEISYANIKNHKNHMSKSNLQNMQRILNNSMRPENVEKLRADNVADLLKLTSYLEQHPENDASMDEFRSEFEIRLEMLESVLQLYGFVDDYQYEPDKANSYISRSDNEMMAKRSILSVVRACMCSELNIDGKMDIGHIIAGILDVTNT